MKTAFAFLLLASVASPADYGVAYVRIVDKGTKPWLQDIRNIHVMEPGASLYLHPANAPVDGSEDVPLFVPPDANGAVLDPVVSLDGTRVFFSYTKDATYQPFGWEAAINLYAVNVATKAVTQLTFSTEAGDYNLGACEVPGGRLVYTSSINRLSPVNQMDLSSYKEGQLDVVLQLFALKLSDPANTVEQVGFLNLRGALHPTLLKDGRIMWSSAENHGIRSARLWGLWASLPDGRKWEPLWSAFERANDLSFLHWQSQAPNGRIQLVFYYPIKSSGYGNLLDFRPNQGFGSPNALSNPTLPDRAMTVRFPFQPVSNNDPFGTEPQTRSLTPWTTAKDSGPDGVTHPSGAPDGVLVSSGQFATDDGGTGAGATRRIRSSGIYLIPGGNVSATPADLVKVVDAPGFYEIQPRALLPWNQIYGSDPVEHPWLPDSKNADGTTKKYGYVGSSGVYQRESKQEHAGDEYAAISWGQGGDTKDFQNSEIDRLRIVFQAPTPRAYNPFEPWWRATGVERMGIIGEIPLRKFNPDGTPIMDSAGNPDTSFLAKIPPDQSWTFQLLDKDGQVLTHSFTWHQLRPGEVRTDCRGCHAHHEPGLVFDGTEASKPGFVAADFTKQGPRFIEYKRDIKPILEAHCVSCHSGETPEAGFVIDDTLRDKPQVLAFRATQSELVKRILGHQAVGDRMPKGEDPLTAAQIRLIAAWVDLGMPYDQGKYFVGLPTEGALPDPPPPIEVWNPANLGPPFNGDSGLRVRNGVIEKLQ